MASCRSVVNTALRKLNVVASGREARPVDAADTLAALQGLYRAWIASGAFGRLRDVVPISDYTACCGERVLRQDASISRITLPALVSDRRWYWDCWAEILRPETLEDDYGPVTDDSGETVQAPLLEYGQSDGYGAVPPRDGAVVVISDMLTGRTDDFVYDGSAKLWQEVGGLTLDVNAPRSFSDPTGLASCLAVEVQDQFGGELSPVTLAQAQRYMAAMTMRFSMPREEVCGVYV